VVVPDDQLSLAIGRRGQNVRLASQLTGSQIDIMTEAEASEKRQKEFAERPRCSRKSSTSMKPSRSCWWPKASPSWRKSPTSSCRTGAIEGFDEELAEELQNRANEALERREEAARAERRELGVEDALAELPHLTEAMLVTLGKAGIKTLDDLADLATDELIAKKRGPEQRRRNKEATAATATRARGAAFWANMA
jgi:N utilization substance protein A